MDKLQTNYNGRMPFDLDDIRWEQDAVRDAFYGFISAFGIDPTESFKLSGCVVGVVGTTYTTTAGYICLNGEILKVEAHSVTVAPLKTAKWSLSVSYDSAGTEVFEDSTTHDTYEKRRGVLIETESEIPPTYMEYDAPYLIDVIHAYEDWHEVGESGEPTMETDWSNKSGEDTAAFRLDNNGVVHIKGTVTGTNAEGNIFTLPVGYRPAARRNFITNYMGTAATSISVTPEGYVWCNTTDSSDVSLDISFAL
jgi:hypothetical protein